MRYAKVTKCDGGRIFIGRESMWAHHHPAVRKFRFGRCSNCDVRTLPWVTRYLDPTWWPSTIRMTRYRLSNWWYWNNPLGKDNGA